jgi:hypothetical protein
MSLTIVVPFLNRVHITNQALRFLLDYKTDANTRIVLFDNGSSESFSIPEGVQVIRMPSNIGNYPVFFEIQRRLTNGDVGGDIIGFFHSDFLIEEKGYDTKIIQAFRKHPQLGLLGMVWSTEIDLLGGRGSGTRSNFQGLNGGSTAEQNGGRFSKYMKAVVLDGCSMIFRKNVLEALPLKVDFPPHHFYDKLISCQVQEMGYEVSGLGLACDHVSGQTANTQQDYFDLAQDWCYTHLGIQAPEEYKTVEEVDHYLRTQRGQPYPTSIDSWDMVVYLEAERQFLQEYKYKKGFIPRRVS